MRKEIMARDVGSHPMPDYRTSARHTCPRCGASGEAATFYHAAEGLICGPCHTRDKRADRARNQKSEARIDAMMNGLLALACGVGAALFAFSAPDGPMPVRAVALFALALAATATCVVRSFRFASMFPRAPAARTVSLVGAALAFVALGEFVLRMA
jgi:hypothetical protein